VTKSPPLVKDERILRSVEVKNHMNHPNHFFISKRIAFVKKNSSMGNVSKSFLKLTFFLIVLPSIQFSAPFQTEERESRKGLIHWFGPF